MDHVLSLARRSIPLSIDEDFLRRLYNRRVWLAEHGLMLAILEDAINCYRARLWTGDKAGEKLFRETEQWIMECNSDWIFSFENICETLGLSPSCLRQSLICWKVSQLATRNRRIPRKRNLGKVILVVQ